MSENNADKSSCRYDNSKTYNCSLAKGDIEIFRLGCDPIGVSCPHYVKNRDHKGHHCKQITFYGAVDEGDAVCAYARIILFQD